jgi:hypothetical protein
MPRGTGDGPGKGIGEMIFRSNGRYGDWFQTYTGKKFYPLDPRADEVCIEDIAHALAMQCRFGGHCRDHYSVAEHSVRASFKFPEDHALSLLLHDATEAYLVDLPRPIKRSGVFGWLYRRIEARVEREIAIAFNVKCLSCPKVKRVDSRMLLTEKRDLLADPPSAWKESEGHFPPYQSVIKPASPRQAENAFLKRFTELTASAEKRNGCNHG